MLRLCLTIAAFTLVGCVSGNEVYLANGMRAYQLDCRYTIHGLSSCYEAASELCLNRGFALYDWSGVPWKLPYPDPEGLESRGILAIDRILVACRT